MGLISWFSSNITGLFGGRASGETPSQQIEPPKTAPPFVAQIIGISKADQILYLTLLPNGETNTIIAELPQNIQKKLQTNFPSLQVGDTVTVGMNGIAAMVGTTFVDRIGTIEKLSPQMGNNHPANQDTSREEVRLEA